MANVKINVDQSQLNTAIDKLNKITEKLKESTKVKKINIDSSGISKISIDVKKLGSSLNGINSKLSTLKNTLLAYFSISAIRGFASQIDEGAKRSLEFSQIQDRLKQSLATTGRLKFYDQILKQQDEVRKSSTFTRTQLIEAANSATQVKGVGFNKLLQLGRDAGAYRKINPNQVIEELGGIENKDQVRDFVKKYGNVDKLTENSLKLLFDPTLRGYGARRAAANLTLESIGGTDERQRKENEGFYKIQNSKEDFSQKVDSLKLKLENILGPTISNVIDRITKYLDNPEIAKFIEKLPKIISDFVTFLEEKIKLFIPLFQPILSLLKPILDLLKPVLNLLKPILDLLIPLFNILGPIIKLLIYLVNAVLRPIFIVLTPILSLLAGLFELMTPVFNLLLKVLGKEPDKSKTLDEEIKEKEDQLRKLENTEVVPNEEYTDLSGITTYIPGVSQEEKDKFIKKAKEDLKILLIRKNFQDSLNTPPPPPPPIKETNQKGYSGGLDVNNIQQVRKTEIHIGVINGINGGNFGILDISNKEAVKNFANYVGKTLAETVENGGVGSVQVAPQ